MEPEVLTYQTTPPATGIHADTDNSLSDDDKNTARRLLQLKYGILRLENCALISEAARALLATIERITNDSVQNACSIALRRNCKSYMKIWKMPGETL